MFQECRIAMQYLTPPKIASSKASGGTKRRRVQLIRRVDQVESDFATMECCQQMEAKL